MRISTEIEVFGIKVEDDEIKVKVTPGLGIERGPLGAEVDYDLAGDWLGVNLFYMIGG